MKATARLQSQSSRRSAPTSREATKGGGKRPLHTMSESEKSKIAAASSDPQHRNSGSAKSAEPSADDPGHVDKIRDILFGGQMRDYERKFNRLEDRLSKDIGDLREDFAKRLSGFEAYLKDEVEALLTKIKAERNDREESCKGLSQDLVALSKALEKKISQLDDQSTKGMREIRQQILDQSKHLSEEIRQKHEAMVSSLNREAADLRETKVDRSGMADLLTEVALRLKNEFQVPKGK